MVNVVVAKKRTVKVSSNTTAGVIDSNVPVTLKNFQIGATTRLDKLTDVDASSETDKATLVYDVSSDKYIVKQLEFSEISGDLDGGTF